MSYILDALRRADAERERGQLPSLHSQVGLASPPQPGPAAAWPWALGLLGVGGLAAAGWWWLAPTTPAPPPTTQLTTAPGSGQPLVAAPSPGLPAPRPNPAATQSQVMPQPPTLPPPTPVTGPAAQAPTSAPAALAKPQPPSAPSRPADTPLAPTAPAPAAEPAVLLLQQLPDSVRNQLPTLVIGGAMFSDNPGQRMLIVNGQVLQEGAQVAPGLVLQQIQLRRAVLSYQGYRYAIDY